MADGERTSMPPTPRYEGEDTRPTSEKELRGWFSYGIAAEVYAVCGVGSFLPVTLEQLARERGVSWSDRTTPCIAPPSPPVKSGSDAKLVALLARAAAADDNNQCMIKLFGNEITTASFAMYTFSTAVFVQAILLASIGATADHGDRRKRLLLGFGVVGAISSMLFVLVFPSIYLLAPVLVIIGVVCLGCSFVLMNSFLPLLVAAHPSVALAQKASGSQESVTPQLSARISAKGAGLGYAAAVFVQILSILLLFTASKIPSSSKSATLPMRLVLFMTGAWWFLFTIPTALWLRDRPGPPLAAAKQQPNVIGRALAYTSFAWRSLWRTIKTAASLRQAAIFLIAWFLLSDAIASMSGTAILFARTELKMGTISIALLSITSQASGMAGAFFWPIISRYRHMKTNVTIISCIAIMEIIPLYGLLGYVPFIKAWGVGGLQQPWEIFPLAMVHGFVMGGITSYCRSFYGLLIPPGMEAAFYALYAITDKGSSAVGPTVIGIIVDRTGTIRPAFWFLAVLIALPGPLIWLVDVEQGRADAVRMAGLKENLSSYDIGLRTLAEEGSAEAEGLMGDHDGDEDTNSAFAKPTGDPVL